MARACCLSVFLVSATFPGSFSTASSAFASAPAAQTDGLFLFPRAFSPGECERIVAQLESAAVPDRDVRVHASVSRTNYWDHAPASGRYDWIYQRLLTLLNPVASRRDLWGFDLALLASSPSAFAKHVDFVLVHEFKSGDFFDWHVDTKPGDGTGRTVNINVMLSPPDAYAGGDLEVGTATVRAQQGDLTCYPAALPHRVEDITWGRRLTLVVAVRIPDDADDAQRAACGYWALAASNHERLRAQKGGVPKLNIVRAEWLAAQGDEEGADGAYADAYACTPEAPAYAKRFSDDGAALLAAGDSRGALQHFRMAARVDGGNPAYAAQRDALLAELDEAASKGGMEEN